MKLIVPIVLSVLAAGWRYAESVERRFAEQSAEIRSQGTEIKAAVRSLERIEAAITARSFGIGRSQIGNP